MIDAFLNFENTIITTKTTKVLQCDLGKMARENINACKASDTYFPDIFFGKVKTSRDTCVITVFFNFIQYT